MALFPCVLQPRSGLHYNDIQLYTIIEVQALNWEVRVAVSIPSATSLCSLRPSGYISYVWVSSSPNPEIMSTGQVHCEEEIKCRFEVPGMQKVLDGQLLLLQYRLLSNHVQMITFP